MKNTIIMWTMLVLLSFLTACGGSDSAEGSRFDNNTPTDSDDDTDEDTVIDEGDFTNVSFLPLMTFEKYKDWLDGTNEGILLSYNKSPFIAYYTINPVNASNLQPITTAQASDFTIVEDDIPLNPKVNFPILQKVLGNSVQLVTALVINTSSTMDAVDKAAFIQEIKNLVTAAKASNNSFMSGQAFTVWGYDGVAVEETAGYKFDTSSIHAALDQVLAKWQVAAYRQNTGSNYTYDAVVEAIGRYVGDGAFSVTAAPLTFRDGLSGEQNDLVEFISPDQVLASSIVVFSSGFSSTNRFDDEFLSKALDSQSTFVYEEGITPAGASTETKNLAKTFVYVVPDGEAQDSVLVNKATKVISNTLSGGKYSFSTDVLTAIEADIELKTAADNQHVLRFASSLRAGKGHTRQIRTRTAEDKYGYTINVDKIDLDPAEAVEMPVPSVEITGANNEYLSAGTMMNSGYSSAVAYANEITRFYPATRWTNQTFTNSDYQWSSVPANAFTENSDGSVTINTALLPIVLTLTNDKIQHEGAVVSDDFTLSISASK
ncbi:hypothetical protein QNI23_016080 [Bermanella sp. WJH001]|uniref:hypothetical protein n=1 Tax=Bermanella sp. WJH001 TaxID=3048005 RepID=UPI0024BEF58E|nr:hypothetical protein [Bermanella sp. WJH001]MDJ1539039.1 hypothetical protein [Bermanella sp. WJH001]